ncbi:thioredoxin [Sulfurifustis variabilis]|uniref:Thioredoxin n=1 Tax=Sulfurifustis variabilis TaxID=1675686 RepID=A0A1B4V008_9GAMM|nr:thioredoxin domain-containing protein [Sulfurifustis variabilis]BAU46729.1 thioredoxin [Sulfurifustis variabilis]
MAAPAHTNRLVNETSPYLLQHAHNPVDWYPWGEEALERAQREDRPILLSIGYSACHWCHVMEHESFEDEAVATLMNALFVNIKVDREERPDLDKIYQTAHQLLTQRPGGWPLNVFLTPDDRMPFFAGTYFPKTAKYGMAAFPDILKRIAEVYRAQREAIRGQNESLRDIFARLTPAGAPAAAIEAGLLDRARGELGTQYDARHGGFGRAPKFPHPTSLEFLLNRAARGGRVREPDPDALEMVRHTLTRMAWGGLYDQIGGGFCRYSVDEQWTIPHFEKMLYDNAQLLPLYADAALLTGDSLFRRIARETGEWVMGEMQADTGGYYSTLDADSEGHEGTFYLWEADELERLLGPGEWDAVETRFGLRGSPNFEGRWHLNVRADTAAVADRLQITEAEVCARLASARAKLLAARARRARPARDEKVLTSWNGLMIKGMARAGRQLAHAGFVESAERAFAFARGTLWRDGRLFAVTKDGRTTLNAYLDDYAFLIDGGLELVQARFRADDLEFVIALADALLARFEDRANGAFYFTSEDHERLVYRPKPATDDATPSGNGVAARALLRLGHLLGEARYLDAAERALRALSPAVENYPSAHGALLLAIEDYLDPPQTIVLRGAPDAALPWIERLSARYAPGRIVVAVPSDAVGLPGELAARVPRGEVTAYVCTGRACQAPVTALAELEPLASIAEAPG